MRRENVKITSLRKDRTGFRVGEKEWFVCNANGLNKGDVVSFDVAEGPINKYGFPDKLAINIQVVEKANNQYGSSPFKKGAGGHKIDPSFEAGVTVGAALNNAALLIAHGKAELKDIEKLAIRICVVAKRIKAGFEHLGENRPAPQPAQQPSQQPAPPPPPVEDFYDEDDVPF